MTEPENRTSEKDIPERQTAYLSLRGRLEGPLMLGGISSLGIFVAGAVFRTLTQEPTFSDYPTNLFLNGVLMGKQVDLAINVDLFLRNGIPDVIPYALVAGAAVMVKTFLDEDRNYRAYLNPPKKTPELARDPMLVRAQGIIRDIEERQHRLRQELGLKKLQTQVDG